MTQELKRPDPDELLRRITQEDQMLQEKRGYLKVFLGYVAGVGKTFRMLHEALHLRKDGHAVFAAVVETHGREETEIFLSGIPSIPKKQIKYGGMTLTELDLDQVLRQHPQYVLVDELAHTNVPGSRHEKRYQDIEELLNAGINVYTCVNVQHLESVNDIVYQITGVRVKETVPDRILEMADKIEVIDLPAEELLQRLHEGKVYVPDKARVAAMMFFRQANLLALREIALRYAATRVDDAMLSYKEKHGITEMLPAGSKLLACVSPSPSAGNIIRTTHRFADELKSEWFAVYVDSPRQYALKADDQLQLDKNLNLAREMGANIVRLSGDHIVDELIHFARTKNVTLIVIGFSRRSKFEEILKGSIISEIVHKSDPIQVLFVPGHRETPPKATTNNVQKSYFNFKAWLVSLISTFLITGLGVWLRPVLELHDILLLFVIPIVLSSVISGMQAGVLASFLAVASYNFFFIPPLYTFNVHDIRFLLTFGMLLFVGIVTSFLANLVKRQSETVKQREKFIQTLYEFSRKLLATDNFNTVLLNIVKNVSELFDAETLLLLPDNGKLMVAMKSAPEIVFAEHELGIAQWTFENKKRAGLGTKTLVSSQWQYFPLILKTNVIGVLALKPDPVQASLTYEKELLLESFTNIVALTLSRFYESGL